MSKLITTAKQFVKAEEGASLVEYGLLVGLIACVCIVAITGLGTAIDAMFVRLANKLTGVGA